MKLLLLLSLCLVPTSRLLSIEQKNIVDSAVAAGDLETWTRALGAAGLAEVLKGEGPFTVFAPTDAAFAKLPTETLSSLLEPENKLELAALLKHHVVAGSLPAAKVTQSEHAQTLTGQRIDFATKGDTVTVDGAAITRANVRCTNGIIHVIDTVLMPAREDLLATAEEIGGFETLARAIAAAGLAETLEGKAPHTLFAPTDEAFAALPEGTLESLLEPVNRERLKTILGYHVITGSTYTDQLAKTRTIKTLQGGELTIEKVEGEITIQGAKIIEADVEASNGVIHVVDKVILPR